MQVVASENLFSFFYDRVQDARKLHGTDVEEGTEFYLVNLLMQFLKTPRLVSVGGTRVDDQPLAIRLLEGRSGSSKGDRFLHLKHLADSTLYKLGFFADSLRRSSVDLKYYAGVGGSAYRDLSRLTGWKGDPVFGELAERFDDCVELLTTVKEGAPEHGDVVKLYELWASTGDERAEARLRSLGVMLDGPERTH